MNETTEMRWFLTGAVPPRVGVWFADQHSCIHEAEREDAYLLFPNCETAGVKVRGSADGGVFEIKVRASPGRPWRVRAEVIGRMDQWVKWSLQSPTLLTLNAELQQRGQWVRVRKQRSMRKFSAEDSRLREVTSRRNAWPEIGCNVELTELLVGPRQQPWFTLGFEAFGPAAQTRDVLDKTLGIFFGARAVPRGLELSLNRSLSYPGWLVTLQGDGVDD